MGVISLPYFSQLITRTRTRTRTRTLDCSIALNESRTSSTKGASFRISVEQLIEFHDASKTGVAQEAMQNAVRKAGKAINEQEARQILGVTEQTSWEEILQKYDKLFENNAKAGSFYLQSKVLRAKECLEVVYRSNGTPS